MIGGYRSVLTPNGVFALQAFALFALIIIKAYHGQFLRTRRPLELLFLLFFISYIILRSIADLLSEPVTVQNVSDVIKPIIIMSCLSLAFFRFQLVDDLLNQAPCRHLSHWIVIFGTVSTLLILSLHLTSFRIGRLYWMPGAYFSTLYVFSSLLLTAALLSKKKLFSNGKSRMALVFLLSRLFVDLRRTPVAIMGIFIVSYIGLLSLRFLLVNIKRKKNSMFQKVLRLAGVLLLGAGPYWLIVNGHFSRLNWNAIQFALFDVRLMNIKTALDEVLLVNPFFGLGPVFELNLQYSGQVHSLPAALFVSFGWVGLTLFLLLPLRLLFDVISTTISDHPGAEDRLAFLTATLFYLIFFTFSARGFEIESFSIFALALTIGMKKT